MDTKSIIELVAIAMFPVGFIAILVQRIIMQRSVGVRIIQLTAVVMLIPTIVVLGLEKVLEPATLGTLIGALTGYLLSGIGEYHTGDRTQPTEITDNRSRSDP
jgi:hypothetical protein